MSKRIYIPQAIPYVNAAPHIGHALEFVQADTLARFYLQLEYEVFYSTGADENSLKNVQAAEVEGIPTKELVDKNAKKFEDLKSALNLSWDIFNRTSDEHHFAGAQKLWKLCKKEDIYKKNYKGLYCVGCEIFYTPEEIVGGKCPDGHTNIEEQEEENYFFKLSNYQKFLEDLIETDKLKIVPETRKNEVLSFIKQGLADFSISRTRERARGWGVPVPGDNSQVMYVWFDALTTYLTALGFGSSDQSLYKKFWEENENIVHVIGKGIIRFHAVYWIAMLASSGIKLPQTEFVHGYITLEGEKISKSLGNVVDPFDVVNDFGADVVRYYLLREIPSYGDGDFSLRRLKEIYNGELANGLGNLVARVAKLAEKAKVSIPDNLGVISGGVRKNLEIFRFDLALDSIFNKISELDGQINKEKPWEKEGVELKGIIEPIASDVTQIGYDLSPFMPETSEKILKQFSGKITSGEALFPRI